MDKHILTALLNMFWQWSVIVGVIFCAAHWFRRSYSIRHALWLTALVAMPLLFVLNGVVPGISFQNASSSPILRDFQRTQPVHIDIDQLADNERPVTSAAKTQPLTVNRQSSIVNSGWHWTRWVLIAWVLGTSWCILRLGYGVWRLSQLRRQAEPATAPQQQLLEQLRLQLVLKQPVQLRVLASVDVPMSLGWRRPCIILPSSVPVD